MFKWLPEYYRTILNLLILVFAVMLFVVFDEELCAGAMGVVWVVYTLYSFLSSFGSSKENDAGE